MGIGEDWLCLLKYGRIGWNNGDIGGWTANLKWEDGQEMWGYGRMNWKYGMRGWGENMGIGEDGLELWRYGRMDWNYVDMGKWTENMGCAGLGWKYGDMGEWAEIMGRGENRVDLWGYGRSGCEHSDPALTVEQYSRPRSCIPDFLLSCCLLAVVTSH